MNRNMLVIWFAGLIVACSAMPPIATDVDYEYDAGTSRISTYRVEFTNMPEFLKPMLRDEVSTILATKGLDYSEGDAHAILQMTFVQKPMSQADAQRDNFDGPTSSGGTQRFIAEVQVDLLNSVTRELIWSGVLSRYHNVAMGSYMHDAPSRAAMRTAFMELFASYPNYNYDTYKIE